MNKRVRLILSATLVLTVVSATFALAGPFDDGVIDSGKDVHGHKHEQHGGDTGHLDPVVNNVDLVSKLRLRNAEPEKIADVAVHGNYAYLAAWGVVTCKNNGVHVVDIKDPAKPREVAFIKSKEGSYPGEGVHVVPISTPAFNGDLLVSNNETCNDTTGFGGMNIYDVSRPTAPITMYEGFGDHTAYGTGKKAANEIHSVFAWDAGNKAYAVMVDNEEWTDVDIVDITNPRKPKLIAEYDLVEEFGDAITQEGMDQVFLHDMVVKEINGDYVMLLSYWDAGYIQLDVNNPLDIKLLAQSDYANPDREAAESGFTVEPEGNGHQAEFTKDNDYVIGTDEDFAPYGVSATDKNGNEFAATMGVPMEPGSTLDHDLRLAGRGCNTDPMPAAEGDQIALIERGACTFTEKVGNASANGYKAAMIFNSQAAAGGTCTSLVNMSVSGSIPAFFVARDTAFGFMGQDYVHSECTDTSMTTGAVAAPVGTVFADAVTITSYFDGWGYVHLFDGKTMASLDTYAIDEAHDPAYAFDYGDLSIHEVATSQVDNELAYYAYYTGGLRVTRIVDGEDGKELQEVGAFIDQGGNNFWGIEVFERNGVEYAAASDRDKGLYIFRYTGD